MFDRYFATLASEIETNVLKALKMVTMSELILGFVSLVKKALRPQITSPGICKKARKTLRKQTFILTVADHWGSFRIYETEQI